MRGYRCSHCNRIDVRRPTRCRCGASSFTEMDLSGRGKVYSWTTLHAAAEPFEKDLPFQIALIDLEEGPRLTARIEGEAVAIDDPVRLVREVDGVRFFSKSPAVP